MLQIFPSSTELNKAAAEYIVARAKEAIATNGKFTMVLSGGQTPLAVYTLLAQFSYREQMPWKNTYVFWGDERCVPLYDIENNAQQVKTILLDKVPIPFDNIYRIPVNLVPLEAAAVYEKEIKFFFGKETPHFDLILLGLGANGHTASLFPETSILKEHAEGMRAVYVEEEDMFRVSMTASLINQAHHILFLVSGEKKAKILYKVFQTSSQTGTYPAQLIKPLNGELCWFADEAAVSVISEKNSI